MAEGSGPPGPPRPPGPPDWSDEPGAGTASNDDGSAGPASDAPPPASTASTAALGDLANLTLSDLLAAGERQNNGSSAPAAAKPSLGALSVLQRISERQRPRPGEKCDLCAAEIPDAHSHVVNLDNRSLMCACRYCYLLFTHDGAGGGRYRAVPDRYRSLEPFTVTQAQWDQFQIPVSVAFFFHNSDMNEVMAFYPGPAGAAESLLSLEPWSEVVAANPRLSDMESDVQALLIRVERGGTPEGYIVPIDSCYELVGQMRRLWRGFDGGREANSELDSFFDRVRQAAR